MSITIKKTLSLGAAFLAGAAATTMLGASVLTSQPADPGDQGMPPGMDAAGMQRWMEFMTPGPKHAEMVADAGQWNVHSKFWMDPNAPAEESNFKSSVKPVLGGRFCVENLSGEVMGMPFEGMGIVGYDNHKEMWVSVWMDNMSTSIYYAEGKEQPDGRTIMYGDYYDPMNDTEGKQKIILDHDAEGGPTMTMQHQMDGEWQTTMIMTYTRPDDHGGDHGGDHAGNHSR